MGSDVHGFYNRVLLHIVVGYYCFLGCSMGFLPLAAVFTDFDWRRCKDVLATEKGLQQTVADMFPSRQDLKYFKIEE